MALSPNLFTAEVLVSYLRLLRADEIEVAAKRDQKPAMPDVLKHEKGLVQVLGKIEELSWSN